ncbi:putative membrane protein [Isoptericola jiangsuensis]|uniref:Putative membrane protein n=1 Tax=Isoptericola jiangsuensis TaxID=548579 RepID=A0A2A9EZS7_9MICO|nr:DUF202 domain-containing protein [Isoptericola jiangsuensis]PFG44657.1 putative membrane protein [Isoptericola jiangsuensis]
MASRPGRDGGGPSPHERFPRWVYSRGTEPDPRFSLANERTILAWLRTALGLIAGGTALEALDLPMEPHLRLSAAVVLLVAGFTVPVVAWIEWARTERAMREEGELPGALTGFVLVVTVTVVGLLALLALVLHGEG